MYAIFVTINVKPGHGEAFMRASLSDAQGSVRDEPGCFRFDIMKDETNPNRFYLFEVYRDEGALEAHRNALHFKTWKQTVNSMIDGDFDLVRMQTVFPSDEGWKRQKSGLLSW